MSDPVPDPYVAAVCPVCEPEVEFREHAIQVCARHQPSAVGADDAAVGEEMYLSSGGTGEAAGADCRAIQALITKRAKT